MNINSKLLKIYSGLLLCWYGFLRDILLPISNDVSECWYSNVGGHMIANLSIAYLIYAICAIEPQKNKLFLIATSMLTCINAYFLYLMTGILISDCSIVNILYFALDMIILSKTGKECSNLWQHFSVGTT